MEAGHDECNKSTKFIMGPLSLKVTLVLLVISPVHVFDTCISVTSLPLLQLSMITTRFSCLLERPRKFWIFS